MKKFLVLAAILFAATFAFAEEEAGIVVDNDGNVGVGTETPVEKLDVNGKVRIRVPTTDSDAPETAATKNYVDQKMNNTLQLAIQNSAVSCSWTGWRPSSVYCGYGSNSVSGYLWQGYCVSGILENLRYTYTTVGCVSTSSYYDYGGP